MGYFSNSSEGDSYQAQWCVRCVHWKDTGDGRGPGCPVWDLHLLYNYDQHKKERTRAALDMLIPRAATGGNAQCAMFWERGRGDGGGAPMPVATPLTLVKAA